MIIIHCIDLVHIHKEADLGRGRGEQVAYLRRHESRTCYQLTAQNLVIYERYPKFGNKQDEASAGEESD